MARAFIIRPFGTKKDAAGREIDFEAVHRHLIGRALAKAKLGGSTTGEIIDAGNIREDMFALILAADLVVCDVSVHNANVFYELGIRHALRKKRTVLVRAKQSADQIPFDLLTDRYLAYDLDDLAASRPLLAAMLADTLASDRENDSPIFRLLPTLAEADAAGVQVVPQDFREEVDRALKTGSRGTLRLLAGDLAGRRFEWTGLRLIARAQRKLNDYTGARRSLEAVREVYPDDVEANLELANLYLRLAKPPGVDDEADLLLKSEQAIDRVLGNRNAPPAQHVEALTLKGRNHKAEWWHALAALPSVAERRALAMNERLRTSYQAYRAAFDRDLNHFWSGLTAAQMGVIFLDLTADEGDRVWKDGFGSDAEADAFRARVAADVDALRVLVAASIDAARRRLDERDPERAWAEVSRADLLFLFEPSDRRVVLRYLEAVPRDDQSVWDAAYRQLRLFEALGVRAERARAVLAEVGARLGSQGDEAPVRVVLFAGHPVDAPSRRAPRFPAYCADRAKALIRQELAALAADAPVVGLASGAPGADLLFHEACADLGIQSTVCLPVPSDVYVRTHFRRQDAWRNRFLRVCGLGREVLELSDRETLPGWLQRSAADPWERGNRWVLELALARGAQAVTLLVLWDGKAQGDAACGTAHLVQLARETDRIDVRVIDTQRLTADAGAPPDPSGRPAPLTPDTAARRVELSSPLEVYA